jgi:decaprenyl-phosphate phosphoribosyltransferase
MIGNYIKLFRFRYHITFVSVIFGALYTSKKLTPVLAGSLTLLYISFNVLLYGGIYTINALADLRSDEKHPVKRERPLPSRGVSVKSAILVSLVLITGGLLTGFFLFNHRIFYIYIGFLTINTYYSFGAKKVPYLELLINAATHPMRFVMGVFLEGGKVPLALMLAILFLALGLTVVRRCIEKGIRGWEARRALESYSSRTLLLLRMSGFLAILLILIFDNSTTKIFYYAILIIYLVLVLGVDTYSPIRNIFVRYWTR